MLQPASPAPARPVAAETEAIPPPLVSPRDLRDPAWFDWCVVWDAWAGESVRVHEAP